MSKQLKYISLFSGIGGLDYGLEKAGFKNIMCVEHDRDACLNLRNNTAWNVKEGDITKLDPLLERRKLGVRKKGLDLIAGGPPCQSYSKSSFWSSSTKRGYEDARGKLIDHYMKFVEEFLPKVFIIENVPGFIYSKQNSGFGSFKAWLDRIQKNYNTNYTFELKVLNAVDYGVPQRRERLIIVGNRLGKEFLFPGPTHADPGHELVKGRVLKPFMTVADAFEGLENSQDELKETAVGGKWKDLLPCIPPGENYQYFTDRGEGSKNIFKYRSRFWTFLLKLSPRYPSWTIQSSPGSSTGPFHWKNRKLTTRELARIQTLPDHMQFFSSRRSSQKLIGNAVPSALAELLGKEIRRQIFQHRCPKRLYMLPKKSEQIYRVRYSKEIPDIQ